MLSEGQHAKSVLMCECMCAVSKPCSQCMHACAGTLLSVTQCYGTAAAAAAECFHRGGTEPSAGGTSFFSQSFF